MRTSLLHVLILIRIGTYLINIIYIFADQITNSPSTLIMDNVNQDELILKQQAQIQKDIADNTKLVSDILPLQSLEAEFQADEVFKAKILKLGQKYSRMRRVRPDGNCFFRAVGYSLFEEDGTETSCQKHGHNRQH